MTLHIGVLCPQCRHRLNYSDHYNLCLEGYKDMNDGKILASNIIAAASKNGASLRIEVSDHYKRRRNE